MNVCLMQGIGSEILESNSCVLGATLDFKVGLHSKSKNLNQSIFYKGNEQLSRGKVLITNLTNYETKKRGKIIQKTHISLPPSPIPHFSIPIIIITTVSITNTTSFAIVATSYYHCHCHHLALPL